MLPTDIFFANLPIRYEKSDKPGTSEVFSSCVIFLNLIIGKRAFISTTMLQCDIKSLVGERLRDVRSYYYSCRVRQERGTSILQSNELPLNNTRQMLMSVKY